MKIAIVGSGIAGLTAAYRLSARPGFDVTLIERERQFGLGAHTFEWNDPGGQQVTGDLPLRMFNASNWPNLHALYDKAGIEYSPVNMTQSFSQLDRRVDAEQSVVDVKTYLTLRSAIQPKLGTQFFREANRKIAVESLRLKTQGHRDLKNGIDPDETLADYLSRNRYSRVFRERFLYPTLSSTVCTCSYASLDRYPAHIVFAALDRMTIEQPLLRLRHSAKHAAKRLVASIDDVRLHCDVRSIRQQGDRPKVQFADGSSEDFDCVLVATQANTAARLIEHRDSFSQLLDTIEYENVHVVVHRDRRFLPQRKSDWSTFNMTIDADACQAMCTVWMNRFHDDWTSEFDVFQTINPVCRPESVMAEVSLQRPVVTTQSQAAVHEFLRRDHTPEQRILLAGSWASPGIPLLETGVHSANDACDFIENAAIAIGN
ncbi:FAD-dependent oxidoreductase [Planctomycetes bacterium K23_9]|uniref:Protoporphyrinogen oxidase n=1 Tax=Stieleria marina TaxID=1930275 RepID=A0A517NS40_9BACT|nr:protoporphyrinogen oxidase [Planctomycetes bacterium K23_9]